MKFRNTITYIGMSAAMAEGLAAFRRRFNKVVADSLKDILLWWRLKRLRLHFRPGAVRAYGYTQRSPAYIRRQMARFKIWTGIPLVWSGESRRAAVTESSITPSVRNIGGVHIGTIRIGVTDQMRIKYHGRSRRFIDKIMEMKTVSKEEYGTMARMMDWGLKGRVAGIRAPRRVVKVA